MSFNKEISEQALISCGRACCICHKFCGTKIELHHIKQKSDGGEDSFENCIPLCFDCHADVMSYNVNHPKGRKYSEDELKKHRNKWYGKIENSGAIYVNEEYIELDQQVYLSVKEILAKEGCVKMLRDHNFAYPFEMKSIMPLKDLLYASKSPEFEFMDTDLQFRFEELKLAIEEFINISASNTFRLNKDGLQGIAPEWKENKYDKYVKAYEDINNSAEKLIEAYNILILSGRKKLKI